MIDLLAVYYSETGHTARAARDVARRLGGDLERILPLWPARGSKLTKGVAALLGRETAVHGPWKDPARYDVVVIATPVWAGRLPPAVRGYLAKVDGRITQVAFIVTCTGPDSHGVLRALREGVGRPPVAEVTITDADRHSGMHEAQLASFADSLRRLHSVATPA